MDLESRRHWVEYSKAKDVMLAHTDHEKTPWWVVNADNKKRARLNCIAHILSLIPYKKVPSAKVELPKRSSKGKFDDREFLTGRRIVAQQY